MDRKRFLILLLSALILVPSLILVYRATKDPIDLVEISLNRKEVTASDALVLTIKNNGFRAIGFGQQYWIIREYSNGTVKEVEFPPYLAWEAWEMVIMPLIGSY